MCGIFGVILKEGHGCPPPSLRAVMDALFRLSESRGKEAAGAAVLTDDAIQVYKEAVRASVMIRRRAYRDLYSDLNRAVPGRPTAIIGHSRLVTTGDQGNRLNNQPVISSGAVGIHNGIIVNAEPLWRANPDLERRGQVDSEVIIGLLRRSLASTGTLVAAARETFRRIQGAASVAVLFEDLDQLLLATNNGSLYHCGGAEQGAIIFASEEYILRRLAESRRGRRILGEAAITPLRPGQACVVDVRTLDRHSFRLAPPERDHLPAVRRGNARRIVEIRPPAGANRRAAIGGRSAGRPATVGYEPPTERCLEAIERLRRCTRCILPETMPFIEFDETGVCNYCRGYRMVTMRGVEELERLVAPHRRRDGGYDCLVGLSGGRDSTYGLHYIKTVLKMNPIAFTYDWGMVTDLARRNISRICGQLGVEHILVSADIEAKRRHIRRNVLAWLKRPALGMIPLFMAGDKQYFYHAGRLKKQTGVPLIFLCENMLERTDFKTGFAGVRPAVEDEDHVYTLPLLSKLKLAAYYAGEYLRNPAYFNASLADSLLAFACYYVINREYLNLFRFVEWDERVLVGTLRGEYDWELADDTEMTWRIGDGTASFYNYIYHTVAGLNEIYTLRSNQIRQGQLARETALALARAESHPRFEAIRWYLTIIGLGDSFAEIIRRINEIPKRYAYGSLAEGEWRGAGFRGR